uniref:Interferon kappa n=1 Tax=Castor canadensis TaxID=51338 RepID=A0A8C0ZWP2_CASCN
MSTKVDMTPKYLWLFFFVGLFITPILSQDCVLLNKTHVDIIGLIYMSNSFPGECLREIKAFDLPKENELYPHVKRYMMETFYAISTEALNIFNQHSFTSTWEEKYLTHIKRRLSKQVKYLKQCLQKEKRENQHMKEMKEDEMKQSAARAFLQVTQELKSYFGRIKNYLKEKKYNHCAWKIVQVEIRRCFAFFWDLNNL